MLIQQISRNLLIVILYYLYRINLIIYILILNKVSRDRSNLMIAQTNNTSEYQIDRILDQSIIDDKPHYLIKWKGYSSTQSTWEPIENLIDTLDIVHNWKLNNIKMKELEKREKLKHLHKQIKVPEKTKKIAGKERQKKERQVQNRSTSKSYSKKLRLPSSDQQEENFNLDSESSVQKDAETNQYSFGQQKYINRTRSGETYKPLKHQSFNYKYNAPISEITRNKVVNRQIAKHLQKQKSEDLSGFKVVGKITKQGIQTVLWCFDWEDEKVCEVQLKDGRKVNMKRQDVKKICPSKLLEYYEKLQKARI